MACEIIFADTGVLRGYIDLDDNYHQQAFHQVEEYLDLRCTFFSTTLNLAEISFWLTKTGNRKFISDGCFYGLLDSTKISFYELGSSFSENAVKEWLCYTNRFHHFLDFVDFYFLISALHVGADYIMSTDQKDFSRLASNMSQYSYKFIEINREPFTHDDLILFS